MFHDWPPIASANAGSRWALVCDNQALGARNQRHQTETEAELGLVLKSAVGISGCALRPAPESGEISHALYNLRVLQHNSKQTSFVEPI
jgi:hypothetical protein